MFALLGLTPGTLRLPEMILELKSQEGVSFDRVECKAKKKNHNFYFIILSCFYDEYACLNNGFIFEKHGIDIYKAMTSLVISIT